MVASGQTKHVWIHEYRNCFIIFHHMKPTSEVFRPIFLESPCIKKDTLECTISVSSFSRSAYALPRPAVRCKLPLCIPITVSQCCLNNCTRLKLLQCMCPVLFISIVSIFRQGWLIISLNCFTILKNCSLGLRSKYRFFSFVLHQTWNRETSEWWGDGY